MKTLNRIAILTVMIVFSLIPATDAAGGYSFEIAPPDANRRVVVSGSVGDHYAQKVSIVVLKPNQDGNLVSFDGFSQHDMETNTLYVSQKSVDSDGDYEFDFILPIDLPGWYNIKINISGWDVAASERTKKLYHSTEYEKNQLLTALSNKNTAVSDLSNLFQQYNKSGLKPILDFTLPSDYPNIASELCRLFKTARNQPYSSFVEVKSDFENAAVLARLNQGNSNFKSIIDANPGLFVNYIDSNFSTLTDCFDAAFLTYRNKTANGKFDQYIDVLNGVKETIVICMVNKAPRDTIISTLNTYQTTIGIVFDDAFSSAGADAVALAIANRTYDTVKEIKEAFENAIYKINHPDSPSGPKPVPRTGGGIGVGITGTENKPVVTPIPAPSVIFKDIDTVPWAKESIEYLSANEVISGSGDGNFRPNDFVTRDEFVKILIVGLEISGDEEKNHFEDIDQTDWSYQYANIAKNRNIAGGIGNGLFGKGMQITRQDMVVMIDRALQAKNIELAQIQEYQSFLDEELMGDYAVNSIKKLYQAGIVSGMGLGKFMPDEGTTRAQVAKVIYSIIKLSMKD